MNKTLSAMGSVRRKTFARFFGRGVFFPVLSALPSDSQYYSALRSI
ncbi:MAG: hypothetical protein LBR26_11090 [Prevotella sp.]|jgi:hypothetical protein|nr:hypothetical protein [Prevotella sp.]